MVARHIDSSMYDVMMCMMVYDGAFLQCVVEGKWVVFEDIDHAPADVVREGTCVFVCTCMCMCICG